MPLSCRSSLTSSSPKDDPGFVDVKSADEPLFEDASLPCSGFASDAFQSIDGTVPSQSPRELWPRPPRTTSIAVLQKSRSCRDSGSPSPFSSDGHITKSESFQSRQSRCYKPVKATARRKIEKRHRIKLNDAYADLRDSIPDLRDTTTMEQEEDPIRDRSERTSSEIADKVGCHSSM